MSVRYATGRPVDLRGRLRQRMVARRVVTAAAVAIVAVVGLRGQLSHGGTSSAERISPTPETSIAAVSPDSSPTRRPEHRLGLAVDERAVALTPSLAPLPIVAGDTVELLALTAASGRVATDVLGTARVISVDDRAITVAVGSPLAALVLERQATGSIELILLP